MNVHVKPAKPRVRVKAISTPIEMPKAPAVRPTGPGAAYMRGNSGPLFSGWRPGLRETRDDVRVAFRDAAARVSDLVQNSGFIAGMVDQAVTHVVGTGLRLNARPEYETLGMTAGEAAAWGRSVEARFALWADRPLDCDAEARKSFGHLQAVAFRSWFPTGELAATLPTFRAPGETSFLKCMVIPGTRISIENDTTKRLHSGVFLNSFGAPVAYRLRDTSQGLTAPRYQDIPARDRLGRAVLVHVFDGLPGQVRGISPFAPVIGVAKRFDQLNDAQITSALIRAVFAATIESTEPTDEFMQGLLTRAEMTAGGARVDGYLDASAGWLENVDLNLGVNGRFAHLFPGQKLNFHESKGAGPDYRDFANFLLREIARCAGLTFESGTGDYTGASYASINNGMTDLFGLTLYRRKNLVAPFCQQIYENWLDEQIARGLIPFPGGYDGFLARRAAACRAFWKGAGRPKADEIKTAKAHEIWARLGVMTDEMIASELGVDIEDVYEQRKREQDMRKEYGLRESFTDPNDKLTDALVTSGE